jgi:transposase
LSETQFEEFVLPHLSRGRRGPPPTLSLHKIFNYILKALYMGCQWMMLPIERNDKGRPEIHHTRIYRMMRRWQADGSIERIFASQRLQGCRLLRSRLQHHRAVRDGPGQPQRIASAVPRAAQTHRNGAGHWRGPAGFNRQSGWRLRLPG